MLKRIINFPFVFCIIVIAGLSLIIRATWLYCKNGGEYIMYQDDEKKLIVDIYDELKAQHYSYSQEDLEFIAEKEKKYGHYNKNAQKQQD